LALRCPDFALAAPALRPDLPFLELLTAFLAVRLAAPRFATAFAFVFSFVVVFDLFALRFDLAAG
jgi:hypothetical protein